MNSEKQRFVDFVYNLDKLNAIFALSSVALAISMVWMVWADYDREWKDVQRAAMTMEQHKVEYDIAVAEAAIDQDRLSAIDSRLKEVEASIERKADELNGVQDSLEILRGEFYIADQNSKFEKAVYDVVKYQYEEAAHHHHEAEAAEKKTEMDEMERRMREFRLVFESVDGRRNEQLANLAEIQEAQTELEIEKNALFKDTGILQRQLSNVEPSFQNQFRNMPLVDFIDPTVKIRQIVLGDLKNDINFVRVPKVDRCNTCHVNIDRTGYEIDWESATFNDEVLAGYMSDTYDEEDERIGMTKVLASHPDLDLFMTSGSPHPMGGVGCTSCHMGRDRGVTFVNTAHTPSDAEEEERWHKLYGWHKMHHWDYPMYQSEYVEQSCSSCHQGVVEVPKANKLNRGIHLVKTLGCYGCHKIEGFTDLRKVGPDLTRVASKIKPDWTHKWIRDPKGFRATTKMPKIFDLQNVSSPEDRARSTAGIEAIGSYLFDKSEKIDYPAPPVRGDVARGEKLVSQVGCRACHVVGEGDDQEQVYGLRNFGPSLNDVGSKLEVGWLYAWLKNPEQYFPETVMPNLRLTDQEAADIATYLLTLRNVDFENRRPAEADPTVRDDLALDFLKGRMPVKAAQAELAKMSDHSRNVFLGERMIAKQGCYGCHLISGFEEITPIGTELTLEGSKPVSKLDFALNTSHVPHTRQDWLLTKLKSPRIWDQGKVKPFQDKLRMPNYNLSDDDAHALTLALLSFSQSYVDQSAKRQLSAAEVEIEKGRKHVYQRNCRGCHIVEDEGGAIRDILAATYVKEGVGEAEAVGFAPPNLTGEGRKVQPEWLFGFLRNVSPIRPWLAVRMPTFGFDDKESVEITTYFSRADEQAFPYETFVEKQLTPNEMRGARLMFTPDVYNCWTCHQQGSIQPKGDPASWAPDLTMARERLKGAWIRDWLMDPQQIEAGTKMPTFFGEEQTYLPENMAQYFPLPENVKPEYGVLQLPSQIVIDALTDYVVHGLHQNVRVSQR